MSFRVSDYKSEYLCSACGSLIYYDMSNKSREFCINPGCSYCARQLQVMDPSKESSPGLHDDLAGEEARLLKLIESCDHEALAIHVYNVRRELIESAVKKRVMPSIPKWHAIGDLLVLMNSHRPRGRDKSESTFLTTLNLSQRRTEDLNFIEDIENGRRKIVRDPDGRMGVLMMKYLSPVHDMLMVYGLASSGNLVDDSDLFKFKDIDELVIKEADLRPGADMSDFLDSLWPYTMALRYAFSLYYRTSVQYRYTPERVDMAFILGLLYSLKPDKTFLVSKQKVANLFAKYAPWAGGRTFGQFLAEYATNDQKVPIMVSVGDKLIADRMTLLYFMIHLNGQYIEINRRNGGADGIAEMKKKQADVYEGKVRSELRKHGYTGPDSAVKVTYDYDVLGISEEKKRILVVDAKFRDISPSSISADTLVRQELLQDGQGLQYEAVRHQVRVNYLRQNLALFKPHLRFVRSPGDYEVRPFLVTKHVPLVSQWQDVGILSLEDFVSRELVENMSR